VSMAHRAAVIPGTDLTDGDVLDNTCTPTPCSLLETTQARARELPVGS
jgi:hypothetical protein